MSGSAGLIYEVIWKDLLTNLLGSSSVAVTIILASFMIGLASGSLIIGKKADSWSLKKIAKFYIFIEIVIGAYALALPSFMKYIEQFYIISYDFIPNILWSSILLKSTFSMIILLIPTFMMGTTLPLISKYLSKSLDDYSKNVSLLYGLNTFGAIIGTLIAGFYLLENYGISGATYFSATLNFTVAFCFYLFYKNSKLKEHSVNTKDKKEKKKKSFDEFSALLLISYTISGVASMFYQVSWTRSLSLIIGTSTYAFTAMLATFLLGIAIGSLIYRYLPKNISKTKLYIFFQGVIVVSILLTTSLIDDLPFYFLTLIKDYFENWIDINYIRFLLTTLIMIIPTIAMGTLFPIVCDIVASKNKKLTHTVGKTYAYNSFGATIGAILAGLAVLPLIGIQNSIYVGAFLNILSLIIVSLQTNEIKKIFKISLLFSSLIFFLLTILISDKWNPKIMSSGVYIYADNYLNVSNNLSDIGVSNKDIWEATMNNYELMYYKDGITDTVAVMKNMEGIISLMVNGKVDASAKSEFDVATQIMIGQLPLLMHKNPQDVFLIGYASGITAGSILSHPIKNLDAAEISSSIVEASKLFNKYNNNALYDERLNLQVKDARHMLMTSKKEYDVIVSQPSNPWIKGQSSLFSYDWYKIVNNHLKDDGIFMQWIPAYSISEQNLKIIINTLDKSFKTLTLWSSSVPGDLIILATKKSNYKISYTNVQKRASFPNVNKQLVKIGLNPETLLRDLFLKSNKEINTYLGNEHKNLPINTDDKLITEYTAPKNMLNDKSVELFVKPNFLNVQDDTLRLLVPDIPK